MESTGKPVRQKSFSAPIPNMSESMATVTLAPRHIFNYTPFLSAPSTHDYYSERFALDEEDRSIMYTCEAYPDRYALSEYESEDDEDEVDSDEVGFEPHGAHQILNLPSDVKNVAHTGEEREHQVKHSQAHAITVELEHSPNKAAAFVPYQLLIEESQRGQAGVKQVKIEKDVKVTEWPPRFDTPVLISTGSGHDGPINTPTPHSRKCEAVLSHKALTELLPGTRRSFHGRIVKVVNYAE